MAPTAGAVCVERSADQIVLPGGVGFDGDVLPLAQAVDNVMISHAWIEFNGKITDLSLTRTERQDLQPTGALLILDNVVRKGMVCHSYHRERTPESLQVLRDIAASSPMHRQALDHKEAEHKEMVERAGNDELIAAYLANAPIHLRYDAMARLADN